jgi:hypothetical protein
VLGHVLGGRPVDGHSADGILGLDVGFGIGLECLAAPLGAEVVDMAVVVQPRLAGIGIDRHAADRVARHVISL